VGGGNFCRSFHDDGGDDIGLILDNVIGRKFTRLA
jgi:hypothetical protein